MCIITRNKFVMLNITIFAQNHFFDPPAGDLSRPDSNGASCESIACIGKVGDEGGAGGKGGSVSRSS